MGRVIKGKVDTATNQGPVAVFDSTGMTPAEIDDLLANPDPYVDKTYFHSARNYISFTQKVVVNVTLPSMSSAQARGATYNIYNHGLGQHPVVQARLLNYDGKNISLNGSVPIEGDAHGFARWISIGSDSTNILLHEKSFSRFGQSKPAITLQIEILISDLTTENPGGISPGGPHFHAELDRLQMANGKFDSNKAYIVADDSSAPEHRIVGGVTCQISKKKNDPLATIGLRYDNGDYVYEKTQVDADGVNPRQVVFSVNSRGLRV